MIENLNTIHKLMAKIQEIQHEINCMEDSWDFQDAESVSSGQLSHLPGEPALFPLPIDPGGLLSLDRNAQLDVWNTHGKWGNVFAKSSAYFFDSLFRNAQTM